MEYCSRSARWRVTPDPWGGSGSAEISGWICALGLLGQWWLFFSKLVCFSGLIYVLALEIGDIAVWRSVMLWV